MEKIIFNNFFIIIFNFCYKYYDENLHDREILNHYYFVDNNVCVSINNNH